MCVCVNVRCVCVCVCACVCISLENRAYKQASVNMHCVCVVDVCGHVCMPLRESVRLRVSVCPEPRLKLRLPVSSWPSGQRGSVIINGHDAAKHC